MLKSVVNCFGPYLDDHDADLMRIFKKPGPGEMRGIVDNVYLFVVFSKVIFIFLSL